MVQPQELADVIKMHRKAARLIYDIEKGKETIQLNTLRKILKVLNIKIELTSPLMNNL
jgi:DNA-binding XRE family transcriptional regulator